MGTEVSIEFLCDGIQRQIRVVIAEPKQEKVNARQYVKHLAGTMLGNFEAGHPLAGEIKGAKIIAVTQGNPAWLAGLRKVDVIVSLIQLPVESPYDVGYALKNSRNGILLNIRLGNGALFITIE